MKYKLLILTFATLLPLAAQAQNCFYNGIYFNLDWGDAVVMPLPDGEKYSGKISIPESVSYNGETRSVTAIGEGAFQDCTELTSVSIPSSVKTICDDAFRGCVSLPSIDIPNSVTKIWYRVFRDCTGLTSIHIPQSVTEIGNGAFEGCTQLTSINIPSSVKTIRLATFLNCMSLSSITIPSGVTKIESQCFGGCKSLTSVSIPSSVTSIGELVFSDCTGLTSVTIPSSVTSISYGAFYGCTGLTSVSIPSSVTTIGESAFNGCESLTSITIPSSVTYIRDRAFNDCKSLSSITIPSSVTKIGGDAFLGCRSLSSITIPSSVTYIGDRAFGLCNLASIEVDPNNKVYDSRSNCNAIIETASNTLICGCANTNILTSVTSIDSWAFFGRTDLTSVDIPWSVEFIGYFAFAETGLTSVTIPLNVTYICNWAFYDCPDLSFVILNSGKRTIGVKVFDRCPNLTKVYCYATTVPSIHDNAFFENMEDYEQVSLYVQSGYADAYRSKTPWKWFKNIFVLTEDGIASEKAEPVKLRSEDGFLVVEGASEGALVSVYTTDERLIGKAVSHGGSALVGTLPQQVVVVKVGEKSYKMAIR